MIKLQNVNFAVIESEIGFIVMTKNYNAVDITQASQIISKVFDSNKYYVDNSLRDGFDSSKLEVVINPYSENIVLDKSIKDIILENVYITIRGNINWINNSNLTNEDKLNLKNKLIEVSNAKN